MRRLESQLDVVVNEETKETVWQALVVSEENMADRSFCCVLGRGVAYRNTTTFSDRDTSRRGPNSGEVVSAVKLPSDWLRVTVPKVGVRYLPLKGTDGTVFFIESAGDTELSKVQSRVAQLADDHGQFQAGQLKLLYKKKFNEVLNERKLGFKSSKAFLESCKHVVRIVQTGCSLDIHPLATAAGNESARIKEVCFISLMKLS